MVVLAGNDLANETMEKGTKILYQDHFSFSRGPKSFLVNSYRRQIMVAPPLLLRGEGGLSRDMMKQNEHVL